MLSSKDKFKEKNSNRDNVIIIIDKNDINNTRKNGRISTGFRQKIFQPLQSYVKLKKMVHFSSLVRVMHGIL